MTSEREEGRRDGCRREGGRREGYNVRVDGLSEVRFGEGMGGA